MRGTVGPNSKADQDEQCKVQEKTVKGEILDLEEKLVLLKKGFRAAMITGGERALLAECKRRYGHRPDMIDLVYRAFREVCGDQEKEGN